MIATPCYGGMLHAAYVASLLKTTHALQRVGVSHTVRLWPGDSLITRARGVLVAKFLASDNTHLLFIDGDIEWQPDSIIRLLAASQANAVVCGVYPRKEIPARFPVNFVIDEERMLTRDSDTGYVEVRDAPTGFLMIRRDAIERLVASHPERKCRFREEVPADEADLEYDLFPCPIIGGMYHSEDFGFSALWRGVGGRIWMDPEIALVHHGPHAYTGDLRSIFEEA